MFQCDFCPTFIGSSEVGASWLDGLALGAQLIIAFGVIIGFYFSYIQSKKISSQVELLEKQIASDEVHKRLSVQPVLASRGYCEFNGPKSNVAISTVNVGLGPAIITDMRMDTGSEEFSIYGFSGYRRAIRIAKPGFMFGDRSREDEEKEVGLDEVGSYPGALGVGESREVLVIKFLNEELCRIGVAALNSCALIIEYESIYQERKDLRIPLRELG